MDDGEVQYLLYEAILHRNVSLLKDLLKGEAAKRSINSSECEIQHESIPEGNSLLHFAVLKNDLECVKCLLENGSDPNVFDAIQSRTPLHLAVELGNEKIVTALISLPYVNLSIRDDRSLTSLEIAQLRDSKNLYDLIKKRLDELNKFKSDYYSLLIQACKKKDPGLLKQLIEKYKQSTLSRLPTFWQDKYDAISKASIQELVNWKSLRGEVPLIYLASSMGQTEICKILIDFGAVDKRIPNTNYSSLYVAAYGGYIDTIKLLLDNFPTSVQECTIEGWSALHACCLKRHARAAKLLLTYPYTRDLKKTYRTKSNRYEYQFSFDVNAQDAAGQTALFLAVNLDDEKMVDTFLQFNLNGSLVDQTNDSQIVTKLQNPSNLSNNSYFSQAQVVFEKTKHDKQDLFHSTNKKVEKIVRQLHKLDVDTKKNLNVECEDRRTCSICPFDIDTYCDQNSNTALHSAVLSNKERIVVILLVHGANPNLPILPKESSESSEKIASTRKIEGVNWFESVKSTCIKEACKLNNENMVDMLIRYGARDEENSALKVAVDIQDYKIISKLLSLKSNIDNEYKINNSLNVEFASTYKNSSKFFSGNPITYNSMFPSSPVMLNWGKLDCIDSIESSWLIEASLVHNKKLKCRENSLLAITRIDLSSNELRTVHPLIFRLPSLRVLDLSNNRLESLLVSSTISMDSEKTPTIKLIQSQRTAMKRSKSTYTATSTNLESSNLINLNEPLEWNIPCLEVMDLKNNRLLSLPECIFSLPRLKELDISNNQIRQLPTTVWTAPALTDLIASGNLLDDLPRMSLNYFKSSMFDADKERQSNEELQSSIIDETKSCHKKESDKNKSLEYVDINLMHINHWQNKIDIVMDSIDTLSDNAADHISKINYLNISHNAFKKLPSMLACVAPNISRLNMSYNRLSSLGSIKLYPQKVTSIDMSHNQLTSWFTLYNDQSSAMLCYVQNKSASRDQLRNHLCHHKLHNRLENLKSLNLSYNKLSLINFFLDKGDTDLCTARRHSLVKSDEKSDLNYVVCPYVTTLDLSNNLLTGLSKQITQLKDLSVLNLSNNCLLSTLPPELGLSSKLWNLNLVGCNLNEPLKSIVECKGHKMMDVIGYLRSILEDSKPYARMKLMLVGSQGIGKTSLLEGMRNEGNSGFRRKAPEHWTKRMGHSAKTNLRNQKGVILSTVGIDIHDWVYERKLARNESLIGNFGPVTFSTWDFAGQDEFYSTHRYFLSKRSIYLVCWRITDGEAGISEIQQWLVNIQSRAPGCSVIVVGTHEDVLISSNKSETIRLLQEQIYKRFINIVDAEKCGFPLVADSVIVSVKTKMNIRVLCNRIYEVAFSLRCPGTNERLLEQKIPASYLYLEEIIGIVAQELNQKRKDPVLTYVEYRSMTSKLLKTRYNKVFRDLEKLNSLEVNYNSELQQATRFLHDNGVLLHYEDTNLRDLYFLDAQWLSDILAAVVSIKEINPYVKNGLMKIDDLSRLFKSVNINFSGGVQNYILNLLNKFEVALTWNTQYLLIPSLLPTHPHNLNETMDLQVRIKPKVRGRSAIRRWDAQKGAPLRSSSVDPFSVGIISSYPASTTKLLSSSTATIFRGFIESPEKNMTRLILLRYLPAGFFARLQSNILSDSNFEDLCTDIGQQFKQDLDDSEQLVEEIIGDRPSWICWKTGIKMKLSKQSTINCYVNENPRGRSSTCRSNFDVQMPPLFETSECFIQSSQDSIFSKKDFLVESSQVDTRATNDSITASEEEKLEEQILLVKPKNKKWIDINTKQYSNCITIRVYNWAVKIYNQDKGISKLITIDKQLVSRILALLVDHVDKLLEDWYPSLGTRFMHTFGGNYLVVRITPCPSCFSMALGFNVSIETNDNQNERKSRQSRHEASRLPNSSLLNKHKPPAIYCHYVEQCILNAYNTFSSSLTKAPSTYQQISSSFFTALKGVSSTPSDGLDKKFLTARQLACPIHGTLPLDDIAPDVIFADIPDQFKVDTESIQRCRLVGRGAYGFVFKGTLKSMPQHLSMMLHEEKKSTKTNQTPVDIALKLLQPIDPGPEASAKDKVAYKSAKLNWLREPFQSACKSYCTARHELNILIVLSHPNIVQFIGLSLKPLAIVLELAPMGSLDLILREYKKASCKLNQFCVQATIIQVAKALEYLHQQRIIYRDLKSENVLVWSFPSPFATRPDCANAVGLKLADYGISRQVLTTGIKGFGGTIGFLAPEILRHNGDEEYTEKVDCFSFGVFLYELLTLAPPFRPSEGVRRHLSEGCRPLFSSRDLQYPSYVIDLMIVCCAQEPQHRPTASQIVSISSSPEFMQLLDVVTVDSHQTKSLIPITYFSSATITSKDSDSSVSSSEDDLTSYSYEQRTEGSSSEYDDKSSKKTTKNIELWFGGRQEKTVEILTANESKWSWHRKLKLLNPSNSSSLIPFQVTTNCFVDDQVWLCSSQMMIHILVPICNTTSYEDGDIVSDSTTQGKDLDENPQHMIPRCLREVRVFSIDSQATSENPSLYIKQMEYISSARCVLLLSTHGNLWIANVDDVTNAPCRKLDDTSMSFSCMAIEESVVHENDILESNTFLQSPKIDKQHSIARTEHRGKFFKVWCGQSNGICVMSIKNNIDIVQQSLFPLDLSPVSSLSNSHTKRQTNDNDTSCPSSKVQQHNVSCIVVASSSNNCISSSSSLSTSNTHIWTSAGCTIHLWSSLERRVDRKLECWRLVPCSESLESISIESYYEESRISFVKSLKLLESTSQLFVGTSHGCIVVVEAMTLNPVTVFKPYESDVYILMPKEVLWPRVMKKDKVNKQQDMDFIITVGADYRDLMRRYVNALEYSNPSNSATTNESWRQRDAVILWSAHNWSRQCV